MPPFFEIYLTASVMLALLIASPLISYQVMKLIAPALVTRRRVLYSLVGCATVLLAAGALFGNLLVVHYYLPSSLSFVESGRFYFSIFRAIGVSARSRSRYQYTSTRSFGSDCSERSSEHLPLTPAVPNIRAGHFPSEKGDNGNSWDPIQEFVTPINRSLTRVITGRKPPQSNKSLPQKIMVGLDANSAYR